MRNRLIACVIACVIALLLMGAVSAKEITVLEKRIEGSGSTKPCFIISDCANGLTAYTIVHDEYMVSAEDYYKISYGDVVEVGNTPDLIGIVSAKVIKHKDSLF